MTRRAFVAGHPIAHSRSPLIHGHWLREHGIDGAYERLDVAPEAFPAFLNRLKEQGYAGGNVTIPHKQAAFRLADTLTKRAERIGAVNTLVLGQDGRLAGDNTDAPGFIAHLDRSLGALSDEVAPGSSQESAAKQDPRAVPDCKAIGHGSRDDWPERTGGTALVLGAGGAARAIVVGLVERGLSRILIANRTRERAEALGALDPERVAAIDWADLPDALRNTGLLVNTTSLGMTGHPPLDIDLAPLPATAAVADIVYAPLETPLLAAARARGLPAIDGLGMLLHQAVPGFEAWFGVRPAVSLVLRALVVADLARR